MSYRITELYALAIPLFMPSIRFFKNYYDPLSKQFSLGWDRTSTNAPYCSLDPRLEHKRRPNITTETNMIHPYSPNIDFLKDAESEMYWLQFSDYYEWPHIQLFDNYPHLKQMLLNSNFESIRSLMKQELEPKKVTTVNTWCNIINRIGKSK